MTSSWIGLRPPRRGRRARRRSSARPRGRRRSSPTGCPADRGRPRARRGRCGGGRRSACGPTSSCRCRPSGRGLRSWRPRAPEATRRCSARRPACVGGQRRAIGEAQAVAPDDDLVAVGEHARLDALAVDEDAVEAAVVEHAHAVGLGDEQRVAARDGRVVEAHVAPTGCGRSASSRRASRPCAPRRRRGRRGSGPASSIASRAASSRRRRCVGRARARRAEARGAGEERRAREARAVAARAVRQGVGGGQRPGRGHRPRSGTSRSRRAFPT